MKFRVQDFDRIFLYIVAGVALVGLIGFGVYATAGGSKATPKHAAAAVGLARSGNTSLVNTSSVPASGQVITTLPPVPFPSIPSGEPGRTTVAGSVHHGDPGPGSSASTTVTSSAKRSFGSTSKAHRARKADREPDSRREPDRRHQGDDDVYGSPSLHHIAPLDATGLNPLDDSTAAAAYHDENGIQRGRRPKAPKAIARAHECR